jgi:hypothetical protein
VKRKKKGLKMVAESAPLRATTAGAVGTRGFRLKSQTQQYIIHMH